MADAIGADISGCALTHRAGGLSELLADIAWGSVGAG